MKSLDEYTVVVNFWFYNGVPTNAIAVFNDTLSLVGNEAVYMNSKRDFTCKVIFRFEKNKVVLVQTSIEKYPCGFGKDVNISGEYFLKEQRLCT